MLLWSTRDVHMWWIYFNVFLAKSNNAHVHSFILRHQHHRLTDHSSSKQTVWFINMVLFLDHLLCWSLNRAWVYLTHYLFGWNWQMLPGVPQMGWQVASMKWWKGVCKLLILRTGFWDVLCYQTHWVSCVSVEESVIAQECVMLTIIMWNVNFILSKDDFTFQVHKTKNFKAQHTLTF